MRLAQVALDLTALAALVALLRVVKAEDPPKNKILCGVWDIFHAFDGKPLPTPPWWRRWSTR